MPDARSLNRKNGAANKCTEEPYFTGKRRANVPSLSPTSAEQQWHKSRFQRSILSLWFFQIRDVWGFPSPETAWAYDARRSWAELGPEDFCAVTRAVYSKPSWNFSGAGARSFLSWVPWGVLTYTDWDQNCTDGDNIDTIMSRFTAKCCIMFRIKLIH